MVEKIDEIYKILLNKLNKWNGFIEVVVIDKLIELINKIYINYSFDLIPLYIYINYI